MSKQSERGKRRLKNRSEGLGVNMQRNSLKYTFTLWSVILILFLTTLISISTYILGSRKISDHFQSQMKTVVKIVAMEIDNFLLSHGNIAQTLALDDRTIQSIRKGKPIASSLFKEIHNRYGIYENIFIYPNGVNPIVIADSLSGKTHGYGSKPLEKADLQGYSESAKIENVAIGRAKKSPITGETVVVLATAIKDKGEIIGTLCIALSLGSITDKIISQIHLGNEGYVFVAEEAGPILAHKLKELILDFDISKADFAKDIMDLENDEIGQISFKGDPRLLVLQRLNNWKIMVIAIQPLSEINTSLHSLIIGIVGIAFFVVLVSIIFVYRIVNKRLSPLDKVSHVFGEMSKGNLVGKIETVYNDEIGMMSEDLNHFIHSISKSLEKIQNISFDVTTSATQLNVSAESFSNLAQESAASAEQMHATTEQMNAGFSSIAENVKNQNEGIRIFHSKIKSLSSGVQEIGKEIQNAVSNTNRISLEAKKGEESLEKITSLFSNILSSSEQMSNILELIHDIADQTQLLSLNASLEAARAGDAGRGFNVVATEIGKLSERTADSLKLITKILNMNRKEIVQGTEGTKVSIERIKTIIYDIEAITGSMKNLYELTRNQEPLNREVDLRSDQLGLEAKTIKNSIDEQKRAVMEITGVISAWNERAFHTASSSEEMSATSVSLASNAELLNGIVAQFHF